MPSQSIIAGALLQISGIKKALRNRDMNGKKNKSRSREASQKTITWSRQEMVAWTRLVAEEINLSGKILEE